MTKVVVVYSGAGREREERDGDDDGAGWDGGGVRGKRRSARKGDRQSLSFFCVAFNTYPYGVYHFQWNTQYYYFH